MNAGAARLLRRVLGIEAAFTLATSLLLLVLTSHFLVLSGSVALEGAETLALSVLAGGALSLAIHFWSLRRYRFVLRTLSLGGRAVEPRDLFTLSNEPPRVVVGWFASTVLSIVVGHTALRPKLLDFATRATAA